MKAGRTAAEQESEALVRRTFSVPEAAVLLGISRAKAYESVRRGQLRAISFGRRLVIPATVIDQILDGDDGISAT